MKKIFLLLMLALIATPTFAEGSMMKEIVGTSKSGFKEGENGHQHSPGSAGF